MMIRFVFILTVIALLASCRPAKKIETAITKKDTSVRIIVPDVSKKDSSTKRTNDTLVAIRNVFNQIQKNHIDFTTFTAKVNIDFKGGEGKNFSFNANLRMLKDSAIWLTANYFLGEAMRVLITKDSVKLINKLDKSYTLRSVSYLQELTQLPLDLKTLQNLIIGNPVYFDSSITYYTSSNGVISLLSIGSFFKNLLTVSEVDKTLIHSKLDDVEPTRSRTADLTYTEYESKSGLPFSTKRTIAIAEKQHLDIRLDFKQYDFNQPVSFPFAIPKKYDRE